MKKYHFLYFAMIIIMMFLSLDLISTAIALKNPNFKESNTFNAKFQSLGITGYIIYFIFDCIFIIISLILITYLFVNDYEFIPILFAIGISLMEFITIIHNIFII